MTSDNSEAYAKCSSLAPAGWEPSSRDQSIRKNGVPFTYLTTENCKFFASPAHLEVNYVAFATNVAIFSGIVYIVLPRLHRLKNISKE